MADRDKRLAQTARNQAQASNPAVSAWVSANAGTGKTHVLTMRVLRLLLSGAEPQSILCLTYTKAAATLMSTRVFNELARWVTMPAAELETRLLQLTDARPTRDVQARARNLFALAIETPGGLKIQTIHAFAERLLQRFPLEAGVAPGFTILAEDESAQLRRQATDAMLVQATRKPDSPLGRALSQVVAFAVDDSFDTLLASALGEREWLATLERLGFEQAEALLRQALGARAGVTRSEVVRQRAEVLSEASLEALRQALSQGTKTDTAHAAVIASALKATEAEARGEALKGYFLTQKDEPKSSLMTSGVKSAHPELLEVATRAQGKFVKLSEELAALSALEASLALYRLADAVLQRYRQAKERAASLDFDDLIARTASLLSNVDLGWVLYKLDGSLSHILVDESQDTAPAQWRIIEALTGEFFAGQGAREEPRTLFAVGDEKQSIYSFQGAEAEEFARMGVAFTRKAQDAQVAWHTIPLNLSFRTVEPVLDAVDLVFADSTRAPGLTASGERIKHLASRVGHAGVVELWPLEAHEPPSSADPWAPLADKSASSPSVRLAVRIAETISSWITSGERLASENRAVRPGDVLILVRKRQPFAGVMTAALKARNIPVAGADRIRLTEHIAVQDLMALGDFLTLPEDDLSLAEVLKSPMFGFSDEELIEIAPGRRGTLWKALLDATSTRAMAAATQLKTWRRRADFQPPYEFLATVLDQDGMRARMLARLGPDAADPIDELVGLALTYDDSHPPSLAGFLDWLRQTQHEIKRDMDHARDEVRVMTVHGAKGLEAPIVFLPDTCTTASQASRGGGLVTLAGGLAPPAADPFVWSVKGSSGVPAIATARAAAAARETAERNRLLYVAMTRARDRLYVAGFAGKRGPAKGCWYELVRDGLSSLLEPHTLGDGREVSRLATEQTAEPAKQDLSETTPEPAGPPPDWLDKPAKREPQLVVPLSPSRLVPYEMDSEGEPSQVPPPRPALVEPAGFSAFAAGPEAGGHDRFLRGTLTHALLQHLPEIDGKGRLKAARTFIDRRAAGLPARVRESIVAETMAVLEDGRFAPLFGPRSRAEVPIVASIPRPRGSGPELRIVGQIDRLCDTGSEILIVDYKTNRPPPASQEHVADLYLYQLAAYRLAVSRVFAGKPVRAALLWTMTANLMEISASKLDAMTADLWSLDSLPRGGELP